MSTEIAAPDTGTLSDHEQDFSPTAVAPDPVVDREASEPDADGDRDQSGRFKGRHRAQSQKANPDDAKAIAEYTKRLRDAEGATGIEQKPGESPRVFELRRRAELAEARRDALKPKPAAQPLPARREPPAPLASAFTEAEPVYESFVGKSDDPYAAWQRELARYDRRKDDFEGRQRWQQQQTTQQQTQFEQQRQAWVEDRNREHDGRMEAFIAANPTALQTFEAARALELSPVMYAACHLHQQGPAMMLKLAQDQDLADELFLLTEGRPVGDPLNNPLVAKVQRRLLTRLSAAPTGSAIVPRPSTVAPRPPNPVRTAPQTPSGDLPGDGDSLEAHERAFKRPTRR